MKLLEEPMEKQFMNGLLQKFLSSREDYYARGKIIEVGMFTGIGG